MKRTLLRPHRRSLIALLVILALLTQRDARAHEGQPELIVSDQQAGVYSYTVFADPDVGTGYLIISLLVRPATPDARPTMPPVGTQMQIVATPEALFSGEKITAQAVQEPGIPSTFRADLPFNTTGSWKISLAASGPAGDGALDITVIVGSESIWSARLLFPVIAIIGLLVISLISRREQRKAQRERSK